MQYDLSILIPARNEIYLSRTIDDLLANLRGKTEILIGLDGEWADPPVVDDPRVIILYRNVSVGQRQMTNDLCKLARGKWVMKMDAHCKIDEGMDVKMLREAEGHEDWTLIPALYNLHVFNWKCKKCGNVWYQAPTPQFCYEPGESRKRNEKCDSKEFEKVMVWQRRESRRSEAYRFDTTLHFQYDRSQMKRATGNVIETMSAQGSCFMLTRKKYWDLNICDEDFGSWGQQGTEVACKTWLSGGKLVTVRGTWYAHLFRTQGGDFGFPFPIVQTQVDHAREYSRELFLNNTWNQQIHPLIWLIDKFAPLPDWHDPKFKDIYEQVKEKGIEFEKHRHDKITKSIIFYTDNQLPLKIAHAVQDNLKSIGLPIVSASLKPMKFGENTVINFKRGYVAYFTQILTALMNSRSDVVFFCEHDCLYPKEHFEFTPPKKDVWYYNTNVWKLDANTGKTLHYNCKQVSGIVVYREFAVEHYKKRLEMVLNKLKELGKKTLETEKEFNRFVREMGFEPGTHNREARVDDSTSEEWQSEIPIVDIRHSGNLSPTRWKKEQFRNQKYTEGWTEGTADTIPGWKRSDFKFL